MLDEATILEPISQANRMNRLACILEHPRKKPWMSIASSFDDLWQREIAMPWRLTGADNLRLGSLSLTLRHMLLIVSVSYAPAFVWRCDAGSATYSARRPFQAVPWLRALQELLVRQLLEENQNITIPGWRSLCVRLSDQYLGAKLLVRLAIKAGPAPRPIRDRCWHPGG
jgi:hypothetical protein